MKFGALAFVIAISLAGCAGVPAPTSTPVAEPTVTPTPAPTAPGPAVPVFGGDCGNLITNEEVAAIFGPVVEASLSTAFSAVTLNALGGIECSWDYAPGFVLTAAPAALIDSTPATPISCAGDAGFYCTFEAVASGYWFSGSAWVGDGSDLAADLAAAQAALDIVVAKAVAAGPPLVRSEPVGAWARHDCAALSTAADVPGVVADPDLQGAESVTDVSSRETLLRTSLGATACSWRNVTTFEGFTVELIPGAGWLVDEVAAIDGARAVSVEGATAAWIATPAGFEGIESLYATDGVNLLTMSSSYTTTSVETYLPVAAALIAAAS